jgi:hypothetical protein
MYCNTTIFFNVVYNKFIYLPKYNKYVYIIIIMFIIVYFNTNNVK